ncbi:ATP-dependent nuclease [Lysinibacillus sp. C5.1]|uniref:ATP-dependent nuclease n=1 Tax=Lysinibacillus sp. C5.1 TaxID=2796169 RepID=UPI003081C00A
MYIEKININNYKSFANLEILCDKSFNIIIGENNIGKSSIFEALLLWKQCYDCSTLSKQTGFYKPNSKRYLRYEDLEFLRFTSDKDLYNIFDETNRTITISLQINYCGKKYNLGFNIECPRNPSNTYFRIQYTCYDDFEQFANDYNGRISEAIFIYKTQPISSVPSKEPYMNRGQVLKKISKGKSYEVLRNKITKTTQLTDNIATNLTTVFEQSISFKTTTSRTNDEYIHLEVELEGNPKELHLQGSGFLQIAEIFSSIEYFESALNIVLLDEPDSHIHTKLLHNLVESLNSESENNQIFIISHNEKFIDYSDSNGALYFLNQKVKNETFILEPIDPSLKYYIKKELGNILSTLEEFNSVDRVIFVEGKNDIKFWEKMVNVFCEIEEERQSNLYFIFIDGKDDIENKVRHFLKMSNQFIDIKKIAIIFDKDFSTREINKRTITSLKKYLNQYEKSIMSYPGYCLESTYFTDLNLLSDIIAEIIHIPSKDIKLFIEEYLKILGDSLKNVTSEPYRLLKSSFRDQKTNRIELSKIEFDDIVRDIIQSDIIYALNKSQINYLLDELKGKFCSDTDTILHMGIIEKTYFNRIKEISDFYQCHIDVVHNLLN